MNTGKRGYEPFSLIANGSLSNTNIITLGLEGAVLFIVAKRSLPPFLYISPFHQPQQTNPFNMLFLPFLLIPPLSSLGTALPPLQPAEGNPKALVDRSYLATRGQLEDGAFCAACTLSCVATLGLCALPCALLGEIPPLLAVTCIVRSFLKRHRTRKSILRLSALPPFLLTPTSLIQSLFSFKACCVNGAGAYR